MNKDIIPVITRAALQGIAGFLAANGISVSDGSTEQIAAGILAVVSIIWSVREKAKLKTAAK